MIFLLLFLPTMVAAKGIALPPVPAGWEEAAKRLHSSMNEKVEACDDFYEFACGNWKKAHHRPPSDDYWDTVHAIGWAILKNISHELNITDPKKQIRSVQQLKIYYDHCMKGSAKPNKDFLRKMLHSYGKWPIIDQNWKGSVGGTTFKNTSALIGHLMGTFAYLSTFMAGSTRPIPEYEKTILEITATPPGIGPHATVDQLKRIIMDVALDLTTEQLDVPMLREDATTLAKLLVKLQQNVRPECEDYLYINVEEIQKRLKYFDWKVLLTRLAENNTQPKTILDNKIYICNPKGFDNLTRIIKEQPDNVIQSFLLWQVLTLSKQLTFDLPPQPLHYSHKVHTERLGKNASVEMKCAKMAMAQLPMVTGRIYVVQWQRHVPLNIISTVRDMTSFIFAAFHGMLDKLAWLDESSRKAAFKKLDYLTRIIGYNEDILEDAVLDELHEGLHLNKDDDPFVTLVRMNQFDAWSKFRTIEQTIDRGRMLNSPAMPNAMYMDFVNHMEISAGILNLPLFQADQPLAVNYGSMGGVLGHELTHGFDMRGVQYDAFGRHDPWMSEKSKKKFFEMAKCVEKQYDHYCYPNVNKTLCVNGQQTLSENIADAGGLMAAYKAYTDKVKLSGEEPKLPEPMNKYNMDQVFFISFGQTWCNSYNAHGLIHVIRMDTHSPGTTRINGTLQNIPDFATVFKCKPGKDKMAPKDHCNVWVNK